MDKYFLFTFNRVYITLFLWSLISFISRAYEGAPGLEQFGPIMFSFLLVGLIRVFYLICIKWATR